MYRKMYGILFNAVTDCLEQIKQQNFGTAAQILSEAQIRAEELYISAPEDEKTPPLDKHDIR